MGVKSDGWIRKMSLEKGMLDPFIDGQERDGVVSYGLSSYGYDFRLSNKFRIPDATAGPLDPKNKAAQSFIEVEANELILKPGQFVLGQSVEYFRIPRDIITICYGKSTYARIGVLCNITPFEPEWEGFVTLMVANTGSQEAKIYANEGIAQVIFMQADEPCLVSYADRSGKYQGQKSITHSQV